MRRVPENLDGAYFPVTFTIHADNRSAISRLFESNALLGFIRYRLIEVAYSNEFPSSRNVFTLDNYVPIIALERFDFHAQAFNRPVARNGSAPQQARLGSGPIVNNGRDEERQRFGLVGGLKPTCDEFFDVDRNHVLLGRTRTPKARQPCPQHY